MRFSPLLAVALWSLAWLPHCMQVTEGIEVDVSYQPEATPAEIRTDIGYRVRLERALIVIGQVELLRCDNFALDVWRLLVPARAHAHELVSPTSLGAPYVLDLMESAGAPVFAGTLRPPPGSYCGIRIVGVPATDKSEGLTEQNQDVLRRSILATGQVIDGATGGQWPLAAGIGETLPCEMRFDRPLVFDSPRLESVSIEIDQTRWFDGIDFASLDASAVQERVADNMQSSLRVAFPDWSL
jgi:hypothetical protein